MPICKKFSNESQHISGFSYGNSLYITFASRRTVAWFQLSIRCKIDQNKLFLPYNLVSIPHFGRNSLFWSILQRIESWNHATVRRLANTPWQHNTSINRNKLWNSHLVFAIRHCSPACLVHNFRCQWCTVITQLTIPPVFSKYFWLNKPVWYKLTKTKLDIWFSVYKDQRWF
jgi:hypothetical protein